jgi:hypothetical protein
MALVCAQCGAKQGVLAMFVADRGAPDPCRRPLAIGPIHEVMILCDDGKDRGTRAVVSSSPPNFVECGGSSVSALAGRLTVPCNL